MAHADPRAGLHVAPSVGGPPRRVRIPPDAIAFQIGETAQLLSGGLLRATAHAVHAPSGPSALRRVTLAVFLQPDPWDELRVPRAECSAAELAARALAVNERVPSLEERFCDGDSFADFASKTFAKYQL